MGHHVVLIPGDGTGPEISETTKACIQATGVVIDWEIQEAGAGAMAKSGTPLPDGVVEAIRRAKTALKGPITTPVGTGFRSVNVALRHALNLYACLRPCKSYEGVPSRYRNVDLVIVRENSEDLYAGIEFRQGAPATIELIEQIERTCETKRKIPRDSGISIKPISWEASHRIVSFAFRYAEEHGRKRVAAVHKANIMKYSDGLFLQVAREVAKEHPGIAFEDVIVDNLCMQLVRDPQRFDVLVLPNLYGDIVSDLCAGFIGGLGIAPGANLGEGVALFEAVHGSAPKYTGLNKVNPTALLLSGVLMLHHLGEHRAGEILEAAIADVLREGRAVTYDLKPDRKDPSAVGTKEMGAAIIARIKQLQGTPLSGAAR